MPALDQCHDQIVRALEKSGWKVSSKPYVLYIASQRRVYIDIHAYREIGDNNQQLIIVEVKCFGDDRTELGDLYTAIGQYILYRNWLKTLAITDELYLAIPTRVYNNIIQPLAIAVVRENRVKMILVDLEQEIIDKWME
jgi:hypothetical protein